MAAPNISQDKTDVIEGQNNPHPALAEIRKESVESTKQSQSSNEQSQSTSGQPAVDAADVIETLSSPSSPRPTPPQAETPRSFIGSTLRTLSHYSRCGKGTGYKGKNFAAFVMGFAILVATGFIDPLVLQGYALTFSCFWYAIFTASVRRGRSARRPAIPLEENRRNPYRDIPSLNEGDPFEPSCARPQPQTPKEQVYQADVHHPDQPTSPSNPSTSSAAKGVDPKGESGSPSTPLTPDAVVASVVVHASKDKSEKDN